MDEQLDKTAPQVDSAAVPNATKAQPSKNRSKIGRTAGALVVAAGVTAGGLALANQANADPATTTTAPPSATDGGAPQGGPASDGHRGGADGGAGGLGQALHGEFVVAESTTAADGTTTTANKTIRIQTGAVTAIGGGSLTVVSTDSFSATYTLGADLDVTDVAVGDTVTVRAEVSGDVVTAVRVHEKGTLPAGGGSPGGGPQAGGADGSAPSSASSGSSTTAPTS
jgi:hypothetical protein